MIDVWSKKGVVLLNISPKADGTIVEEQRSVLTRIGQWMAKHQEAIYGTRAYSTFGYGAAAFEAGHFGGQSATINYTASDIRFTISKDQQQLYLFVLGLPAAHSSLEVQTDITEKVKRVSVLGSNVELKWALNNKRLTFTTPNASDMDALATVFKIEFE